MCISLSTMLFKGCVKKVLYFLITFSFFIIFYKNSQGHDLLYKKTACKVWSIIITKSEKILVLMEGTWYLSLPALLKHVCIDNFVQDEAIPIKL